MKLIANKQIEDLTKTVQTLTKAVERLYNMQMASKHPARGHTSPVVARKHYKVTKTCEICGKQFKGKMALGAHKGRVHTRKNGDKRCDVCGVVCRGNVGLAAHKRFKHKI